jgi:hypothetical protein
MCYSAEVSFLTWGFGMACALFLGKPLQSIAFPLVVTQMQLIEGLRWLNVVDERILAVLGKLAIYSQPVAAFWEARRYEFIAPYVAVQVVVELLYGSRDLRFTVADDGHFKWNWTYDPVSLPAVPYWIGLILGAYLVLSLPVATLIMALFVYFYINHAEYGTHGSLWCVWSNILWIDYLLRK